MKKAAFIISVLTMLLVQSCTNQDLGSADSATKLEVSNSMYIERDPSSITSSDANKVAALFHGGSPTSTRSSVNNEVTEIKDSITGEPLLYIVNYGGNKGFVLISASKNTTPILAYSDTGHFSLSDDTPTAIFVGNYKKSIRKAQQCTSDSLRLKYALQWASFEKTEKPIVSRAISYEMQQKKDKEIAYQEAQGYKYLGGITAAQYYLPQDEYKTFLKEMESCPDPQYDYMEVVQLFTKVITQNSIGELLQTNWHQGYPFNVDAPNKLAGCVPIAVAQITYYHKYPSKYNWSQIGVNPVLNDAFSYFIKDIRNLCEVKYEANGTGSNHLKAKKALENLGYSVTIAGTPSEDKLSSQIILKNPTYIQGINSSGKGHAWVCDGYRNIQSISIATFIPNPNDPRFELKKKSPNGFIGYDVNLQNTPVSEIGKYFHMNLGWWAGASNGWYRYDTYMQNEETNFDKEQTMLTIKLK